MAAPVFFSFGGKNTVIDGTLTLLICRCPGLPLIDSAGKPSFSPGPCHLDTAAAQRLILCPDQGRRHQNCNHREQRQSKTHGLISWVGPDPIKDERSSHCPSLYFLVSTVF